MEYLRQEKDIVINGKNIKSRKIIITRHGKKDGYTSSQISNPQEISANAFELALKREFGQITIGSSQAPRAMHHGEALKSGYQSVENPPDGLPLVKDATRAVSYALNSDLHQNILPQILGYDESLFPLATLEKHIKATEAAIASSGEQPNFNKERAGVLECIGDLQKDLKTASQSSGATRNSEKNKSLLPSACGGGCSMLEVALRVVKLIKNKIEYTSNQSQDRELQHFISHSGILEPTLALLCLSVEELRNLGPEAVLEKVGGPLGFSQGLEIEINHQIQENSSTIQNITLQLTQTGQSFKLNKTRLAELSKLLNKIEVYPALLKEKIRSIQNKI